MRWLVVGLTAIAVAGWYFVSNFKYLYYYYAIWNEAANANLHLSESVGHLVYAGRHIGTSLLCALVFVALVTLVFSIRLRGTDTFRHVHWRPLFRWDTSCSVDLV